MPVIEAEGLTKHFATRRGLFGAAPGVVRAVDWWPNGPHLDEPNPIDQLLAGVVVAIPRSP